jgi:hypothetical protein
LFGWGCKPSDNVIPLNLKASFSPIQIGKFIIYSYEELNHNSFDSKTDTINYWIKETIETSFLDQENDSAYRLRIDHSSDEGLNWGFQYYAVLKEDDYGIERSDFDIKRVKLSYPVHDNKRWDINMFNNQDIQYGYYKNTDTPHQIEDSLFNETVIVKLADQEDIIFTHFEEEVYARGLGLIKRKFIDIETQPGKYKNGIEYTKTFIQSNW